MIGFNFALPGTQPKLLWSCLFDNAFAYQTKTAGSGTFYTENIDEWTTYDSLGFRFRHLTTVYNTATGNSNRSEIILASGDSGSPDTDVFTKQILANDMPGGKGNKLVLTQLKRTPAKWNSETPQIWPIVNIRYLPNNPWPPLIWSFQIKIPSNMSDILTHTSPSLYTAWMEIFALKGTLDNNNNQHRLSVQLVRLPGETGMRFTLRFDLFNKDVNGNPISASSPTFLWDIRSDEGTLVAGQVYTVYILFDQKSSIADLTGKAKFLVVNNTTNTTVVNAMKTGVPTCGYDGAPVGRAYLLGLYTGGFPTVGNVTLEYGNLMIWSPYAPPVQMTSTPS